MVLTVKRTMRSELKRIQRLINLMGDIDEGKEGFIEKKTKGKHNYFYLCVRKKGMRKRTYLGKENSNDVKKAVATLFRLKRSEVLRHNLTVLQDGLDNLLDDSVDGIYNALPKNCKEACGKGFLDSRMEELKAWAAADYPRNTREFPKSGNYAMDHTRVRSKGEELWYNLLLAAGIPFRYECLLTVVDDDDTVKIVCPDFLVKCYDGTMIAIEHLGMMDKEQYRHDLAIKIRLYQKLGFVLGDNLFFTSDDENHGTNSEMITRKLQEIEELFYRA